MSRHISQRFKKIWYSLWSCSVLFCYFIGHCSYLDVFHMQDIYIYYLLSSIRMNFFSLFTLFTELGWRSRYSDWLRAGRPRGRNSSPGRVNFCTSSRQALGPTQPPIQWVPGTIYQGVERPGREADQSLPASAEVKKIWIYTSTLHTPSWRSP
jgi:hypothetical protein